MTLRHAAVSPAPPSNPGGRDRRRYPTNPSPRATGAPGSSPGGALRPASRGSAKPAPMTLRHAAVSHHPLIPEGATDRSAGLRPASRGSAKPAPMTLRHAAVSPAPPSSPGSASGRHRPPPAGTARLRRRRRAAGTARRGREGPGVRWWFASRPAPRCSASSGRLPGTRLSLRFAQRSRPNTVPPLSRAVRAVGVPHPPLPYNSPSPLPL